MQLQPILASLRHHRLTALLLTLQVSLTCAVVCNVVFMIAHRVDQVTLATGLVEDELSMVQVIGIDKHENSQVRHATDLIALRAIPGVTAAAGVDSLPLGLDESSYGMCASLEALNKATADRSMQRSSGCVQASIYSGTPSELATLGLKLVDGRDFVPGEFVPAQPGWVVANVPSVLVSRSLAERLYHGRSALGQSVYMEARPAMRIVGIVDTLLRPRLRAPAVNQYSVMVPSMPGDNEITYVLRSAAQDRQKVLKAAVETLTRIDPDRLIPPKMSRTGEFLGAATHAADRYSPRDRRNARRHPSLLSDGELPDRQWRYRAWDNAGASAECPTDAERRTAETAIVLPGAGCAYPLDAGATGRTGTCITRRRSAAGGGNAFRVRTMLSGTG